MAHIRIYAKPSNLFRYRPLGGKIDQEMDALLGGYIYCPSFSSMNDPMEGIHSMSSRFLSNPSSDKRKQQVKSAIESMGIASMSEVFDHEPMWAHYADKFQGMCVQYSMNRLLKGLGDEVAIARMMYSEQEPVLLNDGSTASDRARLCLSSKTVRWTGEREWRLFQAEIGPSSYSGQKAVTKIYLGSRVSFTDEQRVRAVAQQLEVPVAKMLIDAYSIRFASATRRKSRAAAT
jgi:hypothetical protein